MELTGKIIQVLPERGGVSARSGNEWKMASYVLETMENYPRKMMFEVFGAERIAQLNVQLGEVLTVFFDVDAREYQGRWYNSIRAWKVERNVTPMGAQPMDAPTSTQSPFPPFTEAPMPSNPSMGSVDFGASQPDELPF